MSKPPSTVRLLATGAGFGLVIGLTRLYPDWNLDMYAIGEVGGMVIGCSLLYTLASRYWPKK